MLNIIADIVMGKEDTAIFFIENEQILREDVTKAFQFMPGKYDDPLLKSLLLH